MGSDMPTAVWLEAQVDTDGLALTLLSEGRSGATVESVNYYTFAELHGMAGDMFSMSLTDETRESLGDARNDLEWARAFLDDMAETGTSDKTTVPSETDESDESDGSGDAPGATPTEEKEPLSSDVPWDKPLIRDNEVYIDKVTEETVRALNVHNNSTADSTRAITRLGEVKDTMVSEERANSDYPADDPVVLVSTSDLEYYYVPVSRLEPVGDESDESSEADTPTDEYGRPTVGTDVIDTETGSRMTVSYVPERMVQAYEKLVDDDTTVSGANPDYSMYDKVVKTTYPNDHDREYWFPISRLKIAAESADES